jgi:hypothetical protein
VGFSEAEEGKRRENLGFPCFTLKILPTILSLFSYLFPLQKKKE